MPALFPNYLKGIGPPTPSRMEQGRIDVNVKQSAGSWLTTKPPPKNQVGDWFDYDPGSKKHLRFSK